MELVGDRCQLPGQTAQTLCRDRGFGRGRRPVPFDALPLAEKAAVRIQMIVAFQGFREALFDGAGRCFDLLPGRALFDQLLGIELMDRRAVLDLVVHQRLGEVGFVPLVVAVAAEADHLDDHILAESLAVVESQFGQVDGRFRVLAVDVEDRHHQHLGDVGGIEGGAGVVRGGGEADLVVENDVEGAAGAVAFELGEVEGLGDHPLAGEGGVAVDQDRQHQLLAVLAVIILAGPALPLYHRVDGLEVAGVAGHGQVDAGRLRRYRCRRKSPCGT